MPERRKLKAPSPQFQHSTPKKKSRDSESPSDIHKVLGYSETKQTKKGNISLDVITPEYDDGSSRPMFKKRLKPVTANAGDTVQLECEVSGSPAPKVLWLKNSKPLKAGDGCKVVVDGDKNVLIFPSLRDVDVGVYTARAMNVNGSVMCSAELLIKEGEAPAPSEEVPAGPMDLDFSTPAYFFQMSSCQVQEGRLARFDCRVVAYPRPEIVWMRDGKVVESGDRFKLLNFNNEIYSLLITNVQLSDEGRYTCWARNKFGEAMTEAYLNVIALEDKQEEGDVAPKFLTKFYDQQIMEGVPTEFKCLIDGRPEPSVTWLLNDIELKETPSLKMRNQQGMVSLELNSPQMDQSGEYTCHLSNTAGEVKCSARLTVIEDKIHGPLLPKFLRKFDHQTVREGEEAKFEVTIVGQPKPKVTWMFDHKPIPETSKKYSVLEDGDNYTLIVKNIRYEDDGKITCKAVNSEGEVYCSGNVNVKSGKRLPQEIPETPGLKQDEFDAKYGYVPTFTRRLQDQSVPEGTRAKLECKVMGIPDPEVSWMKDGRQIVPSGRYHIYRDGGTCILTVDGVTPTDSGVYTCIVSNPAGKSSTSAELKLGGVKEYFPSERYLGDMVPPSMRPTREAKPEALPSIPVDKPTILEVRPDAVKLSWLPTITSALPADARRVSYVVESRELPSSDWDKLASGVPTNTYFARNLRPDKEYEFRVRAQNLYGASEPTKPASLPTRQDETARKVVDMPIMRAPPRLPSARPVITDMGEETVRLAWRPVETFKAKKIPPVSYRLEGRELPGTDWLPLASRLQDTSHYLPELPTDRDYMIRVRAENQYGVSEPTESIWLPRARAFPGVPISRPEIIEIEPHVARLRWERVEVPAFGMDEVPLTYMLEMEEPPIGGWRTVARDLDDTEYLVEGLEPGRDYRFRVRARSPEGVMTEPSPAASIFTTLARTRAPVDRLELEHYEPDTHSMQLAWQRVDVPPYQTDEEPLLYMLEYQEPPFPEWRSLVSGIPTTRYRIMDLPEDHDYQFRVRALTPYGVSPPSPALPVSFRQLPPGPIRPLSQAPQISDIEPDTLRLSWRRPMTDLTEPFRYRVEMQEPPMMDWRPVTTGLPDTSYKVTGLKPTKDYLFRVVPESDKLMLEPTPPVYLSTTPVRPRMNFREPQIKELGPDSIQLSWQPAELPAYHRRRTPLYYAVEMMELPSTNWVPVSRHVPDTSFVVKGLKPEIDYKFRVRAETDYGSSEPSLPTTVYRKPAPIFTRHEPIIQSFATDGVVLSWQPATLADGVPPAPLTYRVEVQTPPGVSSWGTLYSNVPSTSVRLADLRPDLDYLVRVRAEYGGILSEPTLPLYIPRRAVPPRIPSDAPYPVDITPDSVKLQWRSAELPIHITDYSPVTYRVEAQEGSGGEWVIVARGVPHTDFFITGLQPDKDYTFRVRAENDYGLSEPTQPVMIRRRSVAPTLPSDEPLIYDVGPGSARLSWRPASFPSYFTDFTPVTYTVLVQEPPYNTWHPLVRRIPHTSYHVTGLQPDKDYSFRIQAENAFGTSRPTEPTVLPRLSEFRAPIRYPEISDVDEDLTSLKLHWTPRKVAPYDKGPMRFRVESWEPTQRSWLPLASGIPDTTYHVRNLPSVPEHLFRVRAETERAGLSAPSLPVSLSRVRALPSLPMHSPQLYDLEPESVRLSWQPAHLPSYRPRRTVRYLLEQREMPGREWRSVASELMDTNYRITGLRPKLDYEFRVRALLDEGPTEPSPPVQLYRRPYVPHVRLETPEIFDVEDDSVGLRWSRVDVPAYSLSDEPLTFLIETQRLPDYNWQPVARGISSTDYRVSGLRPHQDYMFRVRAQYPSGVSAPSPHVPLYRRPSESDSLTNQKPSSSDILTNQRLATSDLQSSLPLKLSAKQADSQSGLPVARPLMSFTKALQILEDQTPVLSTLPLQKLPPAKVQQKGKVKSKSKPSTSEPLMYIQDQKYQKPSGLQLKKSKPTVASSLLVKVKDMIGKFESKVKSPSFYSSSETKTKTKIQFPVLSSLPKVKDLVSSVIPGRKFSSSKPVKSKQFGPPLRRAISVESLTMEYAEIEKPSAYSILPSSGSTAYSFADDMRKKLNEPIRPVPSARKLEEDVYIERPVVGTTLIYTTMSDTEFTYILLDDDIPHEYHSDVVASLDISFPTTRRSISQERNPGYFVMSDFKLLASPTSVPWQVMPELRPSRGSSRLRSRSSRYTSPYQNSTFTSPHHSSSSYEYFDAASYGTLRRARSLSTNLNEIHKRYVSPYETSPRSRSLTPDSIQSSRCPSLERYTPHSTSASLERSPQISLPSKSTSSDFTKYPRRFSEIYTKEQMSRFAVRGRTPTKTVTRSGDEMSRSRTPPRGRIESPSPGRLSYTAFKHIEDSKSLGKEFDRLNNRRNSITMAPSERILYSASSRKSMSPPRSSSPTKRPVSPPRKSPTRKVATTPPSCRRSLYQRSASDSLKHQSLRESLLLKKEPLLTRGYSPTASKLQYDIKEPALIKKPPMPPSKYSKPPLSDINKLNQFSTLGKGSTEREYRSRSLSKYRDLDWPNLPAKLEKEISDKGVGLSLADKREMRKGSKPDWPVRTRSSSVELLVLKSW